MEENFVIQGQHLKISDIKWIDELIAQNSDWNRTRLSRDISRVWDWRNAMGTIKDMACRTMLLKLERRGLITQPSSQKKINNAARVSKVPEVDLYRTPFNGKLNELLPLKTKLVQTPEESLLFNSVLKIANNMKFLILPWFSVGNLASHVLGLISSDWQSKYGSPIHLLETFIETPRFIGNSYKAVGWQCVGATTGRTRNTLTTTIKAPIKKEELWNR